jgi:uncharacterized protein (TIGR02217 family)
MAGFHDVTFPLGISRGSRGGPQWSTRVNTTGSGHESRNAEWSYSRGRWNVAFGVRDDADLDELLAFFMARQGKAYSFRFRDPLDNQVTLQALQTNPATGLVQTAKLYTSGPATHVRWITLPVPGTVTGLPGGASVNYLTGVVTGAPAGTVVTFKFDCKCRFDTDFLDGQGFREGMAGFDDIAVIEVR